MNKRSNEDNDSSSITAADNQNNKQPYAKRSFPKKSAPSVVDSNKPLDPLQQYFQVLSKTYDDHNDRRERLIKLSRDITRNSKAVISLLQRCKGNAGDEQVMSQAHIQLVAVRS